MELKIDLNIDPYMGSLGNFARCIYSFTHYQFGYMVIPDGSYLFEIICTDESVAHKNEQLTAHDNDRIDMSIRPRSYTSIKPDFSWSGEWDYYSYNDLKEYYDNPLITVNHYSEDGSTVVTNAVIVNVGQYLPYAVNLKKNLDNCPYCGDITQKFMYKLAPDNEHNRDLSAYDACMLSDTYYCKLDDRTRCYIAYLVGYNDDPMINAYMHPIIVVPYIDIMEYFFTGDVLPYQKRVPYYMSVLKPGYLRPLDNIIEDSYYDENGNHYMDCIKFLRQKCNFIQYVEFV